METPQPPNQLALASTPQQSNDDQSLISMNDQLLANTFASFCSEMTTVITTLLEANKQERADERKDYEEMRKIENQQRDEVEQKREEQRKGDEIKRVAEHRDDILRMEKLEKRKQAQRVLDQRAHEQMLITMMHNMFHGSNV